MENVLNSKKALKVGFACFLSVVLVCGFLPQQAFAAAGSEDEGVATQATTGTDADGNEVTSYDESELEVWEDGDTAADLIDNEKYDFAVDPQDGDTNDGASDGDTNKKVTPGLQTVDGNWLVYVNEDGTWVKSAWKTVDDKKYYFDAEGHAVGEAKAKINGKYYSFNSNYTQFTGLRAISGKKYYFDSSNGGAMATSALKKVSGNYYYFQSNGTAFTGGKKTIGKKMYYFKSSGKAYLNKWKTIKNSKGKKYKYYFGSKAAAVKGTQWLTYTYKDSKGNSKTKKGMFYFNSKFQMKTGWKTWSDKTKSYFDTKTGAAKTGWKKISGYKYYFDKSNNCHAYKGNKTIKGKKYYFNSKCQMVTGWVKVSGGKYRYYGSNGAMYTGKHTVNGVSYNFGKSGKVKKINTAKEKMVSKAQGLSSGTKYLILVNRGTHKVAVFKGSTGNWKLQYYWDCVTGAPGSRTITGTFHTTGGKRGSLDTDSRARYCTHITGGYFFHTILASNSELGQSLSHGCIRMAVPSAKWIYSHIYGGTTVKIYN